MNRQAKTGRITSLLHQVISLCNDRHLITTRNYLIAALNSIETPKKAVPPKLSQSEIYKKEAEKLKEKWDITLNNIPRLEEFQ